MVESFQSRVKASIPSSWRRFLYRKLSTAAYRLADPEDRETFPCHHLSLKLLRDAGFRPQTSLDIGAFVGKWTRQFKSIFPETQVLMLEAQEGKRVYLEEVAAAFKPDVSLDIGILGAEDGREVIFHEMETGSSVFEELSPVPRRSVTKIIQTVDTVVKRHTELKGPVEFMKLDVQGYELEVLRGAAKTLTTCEALFLEVSLIPTNKGGPLIGDVIEFMRGKGFQLFDFCSQTRRPEGTLSQTDLLFLRSDSKYLPKP